jgi:hypothetical protein
MGAKRKQREGGSRCSFPCSVPGIRRRRRVMFFLLVSVYFYVVVV